MRLTVIVSGLPLMWCSLVVEVGCHQYRCPGFRSRLFFLCMWSLFTRPTALIFLIIYFFGRQQLYARAHTHTFHYHHQPTYPPTPSNAHTPLPPPTNLSPNPHTHTSHIKIARKEHSLEKCWTPPAINTKTESFVHSLCKQNIVYFLLASSSWEERSPWPLVFLNSISIVFWGWVVRPLHLEITGFGTTPSLPPKLRIPVHNGYQWHR